MSLFPAEFSRTLPNDVRAALVLDRAGRQSANAMDAPSDITVVLPLYIPTRCRRSDSTSKRI